MKNRLLFLGPPGAGKGTQASILCEEFGFLHLSTGDLLREEVQAESSLGKEAAEIMNKGELVSDQLVLSIVQKRLLNQHKGWLLDGFPRNLSQSKALKKFLDEINQPIQTVLLIEINDEILVERLLSRGREDDNEEVIRHRLQVYRDKTAPLIDHYGDLGILKIVQGDDEVKLVSSRIKSALV